MLAATFIAIATYAVIKATEIESGEKRQSNFQTEDNRI